MSPTELTCPLCDGTECSRKPKAMTPADLEGFRVRMGWRRKRLAHELEISQDRLRRFLNGLQPIPRHIALACTALAYGDRPMGTEHGEDR